MAWVSGAVKSRHFRQEVMAVWRGTEVDWDVEDIFGFVAINFERSGREEIGIGGGVEFD